MLRKERGISQRKAAGELGISQALLSHYENGIREPGLSFVTKVCDYYHVSADYLLGRTLARDGTTIAAEDIYDSSAEKGNVLRGPIIAMLQKKLIVNTASMLFDLLGKVATRTPFRKCPPIWAAPCSRPTAICTGPGAMKKNICPWTTAPLIPARWTRICTWPRPNTPPPWSASGPKGLPSPTWATTP